MSEGEANVEGWVVQGMGGEVDVRGIETRAFFESCSAGRPLSRSVAIRNHALLFTEDFEVPIFHYGRL